METKQDDKAGEVKEQNGDLEEALQLYLKAGLPLRASRCLAESLLLIYIIFCIFSYLHEKYKNKNDVLY